MLQNERIQHGQTQNPNFSIGIRYWDPTVLLKITLEKDTYCWLEVSSVLGLVSVIEGTDNGKGVLLEELNVVFVALLWLLVPSDDDSSSWSSNKQSRECFRF